MADQKNRVDPEAGLPGRLEPKDVGNASFEYEDDKDRWPISTILGLQFQITGRPCVPSPWIFIEKRVVSAF
jgi:hypothetical protein